MRTCVSTNPISVLMELARREGDVGKIASAYGPIWVFRHPDHVQAILSSQNFQRGAMLKSFMGVGLLASNGAHWRHQRRMLQPHFQQRCLPKFVKVVNAMSDRAIRRWEGWADEDQPFDIAAEMSRLTLEIILKALFDVDHWTELDALSAAITVMMDDIGSIAGTMFNVPRDMDPGRNARVTDALQTIDRFAYHVLDERRRSPRSSEDADDLLSTLVAQSDEQDPQARLQARDEVVTMMVSGHETTGLILSWAWYLLSRHPAVEQKLIQEVGEVLGERSPGLEDLSSLSYCRMVLDESMRLYPPVWYIVRQAQQPDQVAGIPLPAGSTVVVSPYVVHRHPEFWHDAERFDPERFHPAQHTSRHRYAFIPFGGGRHTCLGNQFAMCEGMIILARVLQRYRVAVLSDHPVVLHPVLTLRPRCGVQARLTDRSRAVSGALC